MNIFSDLLKYQVENLLESPILKRRRDNREENVRGGAGGRRGGGGRKEEPKSMKSDIICAYYMQGKCQKTHEECNFSHNAVPPRKMELCKFWMMDCCAKREKCLYLHNDFPCKFYHTGLVCKAGERCKFSHKPLNEITKAVLLKHIETAPKEILGDFPRLNRNGALNLINKMEAKILGALAEQERQKEKDNEPPRRTRWEQPTRDDQEKLQELMEEAGIGGFYRETLEGQPAAPTMSQGQGLIPHPPMGMNTGLMGSMPSYMPPQSTSIPTPIIPQPTPPLVHNPALANVLANLNIPSTTIQPVVNLQLQQQMEEAKALLAQAQAQRPQTSPNSSSQSQHNSQSQSQEDGESPYWNSKTGNAPIKSESSMATTTLLPNPPEHLPPMQKELFLRIQQQQLKNENKTIKEESDDEDKADDIGWYSSDEDERETPNQKVKSSTSSKAKNSVQQQQKQQGIDISSVISSIRQTVESPANRSKLLKRSPSPSRPSPGRGDVDLRQPVSQSHGPFGDTDFRLPSLRPDLRDIDLRLTSSPDNSGTHSAAGSSAVANPLSFFKLPSGPAKEIDASINSHPPVEYKLTLVLGVEPPDYRYIRHTLSASHILLDPRVGPRQGQGNSGSLLIPDPASPPQSSQTTSIHHSPATIPAGDVIMDPRVRRSTAAAAAAQQQQILQQQQQQQSLPPSAMPGLLGDPRFPRDPRTIQIGPPGRWPMGTDDMSQAQLAAQFMSQQMGGGIHPSQQQQMFPFQAPNPFPNPFLQPDFSGLPQMGAGVGGPGGLMGHGPGGGGRQPFHGGGHGHGGHGHGHGHGHGRGRPASSWERYNQSDGPDGGNLGSARGLSPSL